MKNGFYTFVLTLLLTLQVDANQRSPVQSLLEQYQQQGALDANPKQAQQLWVKKNGDRSCSSCHGTDLKATGKHVKTAKPIQPMASSINPKRYQKSRKIEKWFLRNCKWTYGRECTPQEKTNFLSWLSDQ